MGTIRRPLPQPPVRRRQHLLVHQAIPFHPPASKPTSSKKTNNSPSPSTKTRTYIPDSFHNGAVKVKLTWALRTITLSGLLNFIDGLWSSCGDERIIVFTTNHKDRLDPALLRPGRMDLHIHMSYCTFHGFKTLAMNYLKIREHPLFDVIQDLLAKVEATPAEIAGQLMKN
ncbi:hypothetical protein RHGRI_016121 [Rhododendron griersonianum]|uniref:ATPase AAA-type core domain-containing protein n=1 Tax=Rhododendron griersonianum TaxID=479676 RepID=A0AAV6JPU7_9ERIC|nr:hypothetical protein RHGRI_016121 [Rhododendron griersonianum]